jgi:hypothetical protein
MKQWYGNAFLTGAEIGVQHGANSLAILKNLNIKKMYLIDPYIWYSNTDDDGTSQYNVFKRDAHARMKPFDNSSSRLFTSSCKIIFIEKFSHDAVDDITTQLDFIYIDGTHKYQYVKHDLEDYYPLIKPKGIICGHDFDIPDVAHAVTEFAAKKQVKIYAKGNPCDWWFVK